MNLDPARAVALRADWPAASAARRDPGAVAAQPRTPEAQSADAAALEAARQAANRALAEKGRELTFEFDDDLNRIVSRLVDRKTGEVIRQVPSEMLLAVARALTDGASAGAVVDTLA